MTCGSSNDSIKAQEFDAFGLKRCRSYTFVSLSSDCPFASSKCQVLPPVADHRIIGGRCYFRSLYSLKVLSFPVRAMTEQLVESIQTEVSEEMNMFGFIAVRAVMPEGWTLFQTSCALASKPWCELASWTSCNVLIPWHFHTFSNIDIRLL